MYNVKLLLNGYVEILNSVLMQGNECTYATSHLHIINRKVLFFFFEMEESSSSSDSSS